MTWNIPKIEVIHNFGWEATFYGIWKNSFITPGMYSSGIRIGYFLVGRGSFVNTCFFFVSNEQKLDIYSAPKKVDKITDQRWKNYQYYLSIKEKLEKNHLGRWVVISDGRLQALSSNYERIKHSGLGYEHRYIFKVKKESDREIFIRV